MTCVELFCLFSIRGVTVPAMLDYLFRLSRDRIWLEEVSSMLVMAQQVDFHKRFLYF